VCVLRVWDSPPKKNDFDCTSFTIDIDLMATTTTVVVHAKNNVFSRCWFSRGGDDDSKRHETNALLSRQKKRAFMSSHLCGKRGRRGGANDDDVVVKAERRAGSNYADANVPFWKYQGLGNDFILIDNRDEERPKLSPERSALLCDRNFGIGADGVIFAMPSPDAAKFDYKMTIYNSDGSEPEMCGNGIRCLARFVSDVDKDERGKKYNVSTLAGLIVPEVREDGQVAVDMGTPILDVAKVPSTLKNCEKSHEMTVDGEGWLANAVGMGNPHCVVYKKANGEMISDVYGLDLPKIGPIFEKHDTFPAKTNTEFVQVVDRGRVKMRVWERGAGCTLACGTGACATVVAGVIEGHIDRKCVVELPGGPLEIEWRESDDKIIMTGPAEPTFEGTTALGV
jgi:diaminopimelate epimerase